MKTSLHQKRRRHTLFRRVLVYSLILEVVLFLAGSGIFPEDSRGLFRTSGFFETPAAAGSVDTDTGKNNEQSILNFDDIRQITTVSKRCHFPVHIWLKEFRSIFIVQTDTENWYPECDDKTALFITAGVYAAKLIPKHPFC